MWMYNSDHSDSDNFGAESETSSLVTAISAICHSCLDIVKVKLSALKVLSINCPAPNARGNVLLSSLYLLLNN